MIIEQLKKISILYYLIFPKIFGIGYNQFKYHTLKKLIQNNKAKIKLNNYLDERMVEIPWVIKKLQKINNKKILDVGCTLNFSYLISYFLKNNKLYFINIFKEKNNYSSNQISYVESDIRTKYFKKEYFDFVTAISVLEHIGFDNEQYNYEKKTSYTKKVHKNGNYKKAIIEIKRILKKNGKFFLTLPFGKKKIYKNFMQFDIKEVNNLIKIFSPKKKSINYYAFDYKKKKWLNVKAANCKNIFPIHINNLGISSNSVVLIEMTKK